ncbi:hypothetical protein DWX23_09555 [Parabacteroides sp. AF18-52]|jgi:hypothetical protein|nr:hypothetical protein DWX23_09555 [Parabacteroides sp. AF18-52]
MIERILCYLSFFILIFVITKTIMNMATKTLHRAEIIFPSMDTDLIKKLAQRFGWQIKLEETIDPALVKRIKEAEKAISKGDTTKVKDTSNIWESIL